MRYLSVLCLALSLAITSAAPVAASNNSEAFDRVMADAERVRTEAREVKQMLKDRNPNFALVHERLGFLESHAQSLKATLSGVDTAGLSGTQHAALKRARSAAETLIVVLANKSTILNDAGKAEKQRGLLRGKADAIAKRADIVEEQVAILRG